MTDVNNREDYIDSRDVIARIEELEGEREELTGACDEARREFDERDTDDSEAGDKLREAIDRACDALADWESDYADELRKLKSLQDQAEGYSEDWHHGATLIRDSYFEDYARQYADDMGAINAQASWPNNCIDWKRAASELQMDYTSVDFDGVAYWVR
jgi:3-methyladenine DNA glycosylase/8-oxoguanine DNA glycosylase